MNSCACWVSQHENATRQGILLSNFPKVGDVRFYLKHHLPPKGGGTFNPFFLVKS
jgi:hypothetical protein